MELGLMVEPQIGGSYERLRDLAQWSEQQGLEAFARSDHYLFGENSAPTTDALTSLAGLARETERIELVSLVSPLTFRHPAVMAKSAATIDEMSGGRFTLGIGTGWMEAEHEAFGLELYTQWERFSRLFETLSYVRAAFDGTDGFSGRHYDLAAGFEVLPQPTSVRIVVGGQGMKKTPTMAGRFADEYNMFSSDLETIKRRLAVMRDAADAAERKPDDIKLSVSSQVIIADSEQAYREVLAERGAGRDMSADEYEAFLEGKNIPRGDIDMVKEVVEAYATVGVSRFYLQDISPLAEIDTDELGPIFNALRG